MPLVAHFTRPSHFCVLYVTTAAAGRSRPGAAADAGHAASPAYQFQSPIGCLTDPWKAEPANVTLLSARDSGNDNATALLFAFDADGSLVQKRAWVDENCRAIDVEDGGLYLRTPAQTFFLAPHEWMRAAGAWLVRAAQITFADGTRHLTPGYPLGCVRAGRGLRPASSCWWCW